MAEHHITQVESQVREGTKYNRKALQAYLSLYPASGIRLNAAVLVLFFLNLFLVIPVLSVPYVPLYAYLLIPALIVMNVWALALIIAPRKLQLNYVLFRGVFGLVCSAGFMIVTQKLAYSGLRLTTPWYALVSFTAYGFALYHYARSHIRKLESPPKQRQDRTGMPMVSLTALTGLGYLLANLSLMFVSEETVTIILMCVYTMLAFIMFHFILELHRYYWLKRSAGKAPSSRACRKKP
ncbi:hypothetical protein [Paenibacillus spongiae]|uniref:Uncharacterized protein n=1 Tax=Paenibacillus spongiae TaxID=2909671 RepID=A0ABY5S7L7_9BACL|nr:hypothetical protein [Paenibacillus spongiae]UVI28827.1 hypothetical protein L1F29_25805 [Paenibacillus spongiae]